MDATSPSTATRSTRSRSSKWATALFAAILALVIVGIFAGRLAITAAKNAWGRRLAADAQKLIDEEHWESAARVLKDAFAAAPEEPAVMRLSATFLDVTNGDPQMRAHVLRQLVASGKATPGDRIDYGDALLAVGDISGARKAYDQLPEAEKTKRKGMELRAKILEEQGDTAEGAALLRRALESEPSDPECVLRLAMLDLSQPFDETRRTAHRTIWQLARGQDSTALQAIFFLASSKDLTAGEAEELRRVVAAHPKAKDPHRHAVLSAYMKLFPTSRQAILGEEIARCHGKPVDETVHLLRWLAAERQFDRVLAVVPKNLVARSADAFPVYAEALAALGRWEELRLMIQANPPPPVSAANAHAWLALCYAKLEPNLTQARHHLSNAYRAASKSGDNAATLRGAKIAEDLGLWDFAAQGYEAVAENTPRLRLNMLAKVYEMKALQKDGAGMIDVAERVVAIRPDSIMFRARLDYLRLLLGRGMEKACESALATQADGGSVRTADMDSYLALVRALAAFRMKDLSRAREEVQGVSKPDALPPGMRAVMAGLSQMTGGDQTSAFNLAEAVPVSILLAEELAFLQKAL